MGSFTCEDLYQVGEDPESPRAKKVLEELQMRFNIAPRVLSKYEPNIKYLFTHIKCFGEDPGSCVPVISKSLGKIAVHTSG